MPSNKMVSRDTSDPKQVKSAEELHALRVQQEEDMLRKVLSTYEGRHVLYNIIGKGDIYDLQGSMPFELAQSQRCIGRREVSLEVLKEALTVDPRAYILMQQEYTAFIEKFIEAADTQGDEDNGY